MAFCFETNELLQVVGGEGGIRTHGNIATTPDFESGTFDHSATSPQCRASNYSDKFFGFLKTPEKNSIALLASVEKLACKTLHQPLASKHQSAFEHTDLRPEQLQKVQQRLTNARLDAMWKKPPLALVLTYRLRRAQCATGFPSGPCYGLHPLIQKPSASQPPSIW